jgi:hypothetical protein
MKVVNTRSSTQKLKRLFNVLLERKEIFEYFLSLLLADLMKCVVANVGRLEGAESLYQLPDLGFSHAQAIGCDELAN